MTPSQCYRLRVKNTPRYKYMHHAKNARRRGIPFLLTFEEWWRIWEESGHWDQRGKKVGCYCMARFNDVGAYEVGNVRIIAKKENDRERKQQPLFGEAASGFGKNYWAAASPETRARWSAAISRSWNLPGERERRSAAISKARRKS